MTDHGILNQTALFNLHKNLGARMVPFAGYNMPVNYTEGIIKEHLHTRKHAGLFDVSHMGQIILTGPSVDQDIEQLLPLDTQTLRTGRQRYSVMLNEKGGIIDDLMVARLNDLPNGHQCFFLVLNAACKQSDISHIKKILSNKTQLQELDRTLIALQGPDAITVLKPLIQQVSTMIFMDILETEFHGEKIIISRAGYTGEDGFEISVPNQIAFSFVEQLLTNQLVKPIGLGARDSLRLESGLCLYGHDMNHTTTVVEANLQWAINKARRLEGEREGNFVGDQITLAEMNNTNTVTRVRIGFVGEGRMAAREGANIINEQGEIIGTVTSGTFSPTLEKPIGMGYINRIYQNQAQKIMAVVRDKHLPIRLTTMPFVTQRYFRG